ncbi:hypothetical protein [Brevibacterium renqingii]|uniref:hypothetical protein n=1 Tax=Brevibacterium renqingii TaxID=2776916 RepID=UPI001AE0D5C9|nr:hypothetical protein [Brevibacterium renqingii]
MPMDYSPGRIAAMTDELLAAAQTLGVPLPEAESPAELVTVLLDASARWSAETGTRASGPFGTFLAGCVAGADEDDHGLAFVDGLVGGRGHGHEPGLGARPGASSGLSAGAEDLSAGAE